MEPLQLIRRPLISEKSTRIKETTNTICFEVDRRANKIEVR
jgi:ribosomal protein L23